MRPGRRCYAQWLKRGGNSLACISPAQRFCAVLNASVTCCNPCCANCSVRSSCSRPARHIDTRGPFELARLKKPG